MYKIQKAIKKERIFRQNIEILLHSAILYDITIIIYWHCSNFSTITILPIMLIYYIFVYKKSYSLISQQIA